MSLFEGLPVEVLCMVVECLCRDGWPSVVRLASASKCLRSVVYGWLMAGSAREYLSPSLGESLAGMAASWFAHMPGVMRKYDLMVVGMMFYCPQWLRMSRAKSRYYWVWSLESRKELMLYAVSSILIDGPLVEDS